MASKSRRTINPSNDVVLEIITYGGSIPIQRSSLGYQTLRIAGSPRRKHGRCVKLEAACGISNTTRSRGGPRWPTAKRSWVKTISNLESYGRGNDAIGFLLPALSRLGPEIPLEEVRVPVR